MNINKLDRRDGKRFINALGMEFVIVPAGTFWMGGEDGKCGDNQVTIDHDFYIGVYPVTQEEWQMVMGNNPSHFRMGGVGADNVSHVSEIDLKRFPVESVSWDVCQVFIRELNEPQKETGWRYRLPQEAEWEYACRGAATTQALCGWCFYLRSPSNTLSAQQANFKDSGLGRTCKVGLYGANAHRCFRHARECLGVVRRRFRRLGPSVPGRWLEQLSVALSCCVSLRGHADQLVQPLGLAAGPSSYLHYVALLVMGPPIID